MQQIGVLHTLRSRHDAGAFVLGFQAEGYAVPWDSAAGGMMAIGAATPTPSACWVVMWTRDAATSKWVVTYAEDAHKRGALVEVLLEDADPPKMRGAQAPLDFSKADFSRLTADPLWKELIRRIEAKVGQPTGRLPLKKQIEPVVGVGVCGFVVASTIASMGPGVLPTSQALLSEPVSYADIQQTDQVALGGPVAAPAELVTGRLEEEVLKPLRTVTRFEVLASPQVRVAEAGEMVADAGVEVVRPAYLLDPG